MPNNILSPHRKDNRGLQGTPSYLLKITTCPSFSSQLFTLTKMEGAQHSTLEAKKASSITLQAPWWLRFHFPLLPRRYSGDSMGVQPPGVSVVYPRTGEQGRGGSRWLLLSRQHRDARGLVRVAVQI
ncbi:hypothetical protein PIB30_095319 [Stylosanthes scabra]|uniref:Uncharacterized protein n=1 Tax=Stylosanthes scabra TaxID=79078 RepID=A0ABU6VXL9_9FABA|nr:hypothetical protein [Stylosanthes scabra]